MESRVKEQFADFCHIFREITSDKYSREQKEEMQELLTDQTVNANLALLEEMRTEGRTASLGDLVWNVVEQQGGRDFACKEFFLRLFDKAMEIDEERNFSQSVIVRDDSKEIINVNHTNHTDKISVNDHLKRQYKNLEAENELLKTEVDDKMRSIIDAEKTIADLTLKLRKLTEYCSRLETENVDLRKNVDKLDVDKEYLENVFSEKEEALKEQVYNLELCLSDKNKECSDLISKHSGTLSDINALNEEIIERDQVIERLSERLTEVEEQLTEKEAVDVLKSSAELMSTPRVKLMRKDNLFNTSLNTSHCSTDKDGISLDQELEEARDACEEQNNWETEQMVWAQERRRLEEKRREELETVMQRLGRVEEGLKARVKSTENCLATLLFKNKNKVQRVRYRVQEGKVETMVFTKYQGIRVGC